MSLRRPGQGGGVFVVTLMGRPKGGNKMADQLIALFEGTVEAFEDPKMTQIVRKASLIYIAIWKLSFEHVEGTWYEHEQNELIYLLLQVNLSYCACSKYATGN